MLAGAAFLALPAVADGRGDHPLGGRWKVTSIAELGKAAPGSGGKFEEFGETFGFDSGAVAFWARFGKELGMLRAGDPGAKSDWGLYWHDERGLRWLLSSNHPALDDVGEFQVPKSYGFVGAPGWPLLASWWGLQRFDGTTFRRILYRGGSVTADGRSLPVKWGTRVLGQRLGPPIVEFKAGKPLKKDIWLRASEPLAVAWEEGQAVPGLPGVTLQKVLGAIDFADAIVVRAKVEGAPFRAAVFRWSPDGVRVLFDEREPDPSGRDLWIQETWAADSDTVAIRTNWRGSLSTSWGESSRLFLHHDGLNRMVFHDRSQLRQADEFNVLSIQDVVFAGDGSPRFLSTARLVQADFSGSTPWVVPDLLWFDGERLNLVPWERAVGRSFSEIRELARKFAKGGFVTGPIGIRTAVGSPGRIVVQLPVTRSGELGAPSWIFDTARPESGLVEPQNLATERGPVPETALVGAAGPGRLVASTGSAVYLLERGGAR